MYARAPDPRVPRHLQIPKNYSGSAFSPKETPPPPPEEAPTPSSEEPEETVTPEEAVPTSLFPSLGHGKLFGKGERGGIGSEELLLLSLMLLLWRDEGSDDLLPLLILLLLLA
jgi:hypothetical protein